MKHIGCKGIKMWPAFIFIISITAVFFYFFLLFIIEFFIELNYKFHGYHPPPPPKYYLHCPPPPPQYYLRREFLHSLENEKNIHHQYNKNKLILEKW